MSFRFPRDVTYTCHTCRLSEQVRFPGLNVCQQLEKHRCCDVIAGGVVIDTRDVTVMKSISQSCKKVNLLHVVGSEGDLDPSQVPQTRCVQGLLLINAGRHRDNLSPCYRGHVCSRVMFAPLSKRFHRPFCRHVSPLTSP